MVWHPTGDEVSVVTYIKQYEYSQLKSRGAEDVSHLIALRFWSSTLKLHVCVLICTHHLSKACVKRVLKAYSILHLGLRFSVDWGPKRLRLCAESKETERIN